MTILATDSIFVINTYRIGLTSDVMVNSAVAINTQMIFTSHVYVSINCCIFQTIV